MRDKIAIVLAAVLMAVTGVQGVAHAVRPPQVVTTSPCTVEVDKDPRTGRVNVRKKNPIELNLDKGDYRTLMGDATIICSRKDKTIASHDRIATVIYIEKWRPQYKKYFTYRRYSETSVWKPGKDHAVFPAARIVCDGPGEYRVVASVFTYDSPPVVKAYPSKFVEEASQRITLCQGTRHKPLGVVNNP